MNIGLVIILPGQRSIRLGVASGPGKSRKGVRARGVPTSSSSLVFETPRNQEKRIHRTWRPAEVVKPFVDGTPSPKPPGLFVRQPPKIHKRMQILLAAYGSQCQVTCVARTNSASVRPSTTHFPFVLSASYGRGFIREVAAQKEGRRGEVGVAKPLVSEHPAARNRALRLPPGRRE